MIMKTRELLNPLLLLFCKFIQKPNESLFLMKINTTTFCKIHIAYNILLLDNENC